MKKGLFVGVALAAMSMTSQVSAQSAGSDWSGAYAGIQGGYAFGEVDYDIFGSTFNALDDDIDGLTVGVYGGWNWQVDSLVLGVDASLSYVDIDQDSPFASTPTGPDGVLTTELQFLSTIRGRVGYAFDNFLIFAAGGLAVAKVDATLEGDSGSGFGSPEDENWHTGFTVGAGVEAKLSDAWSARLEYSYVDLGEEDYSFDGATTLDGDIGLDAHMVRVGLAYQF